MDDGGTILAVGGGTDGGVSVGCCDAETGDKDIDTASPISAIPKMVEEILATLAILGITKNLSVK